MVPLAYYDKQFVPLGHSYQQATTNSLRRKYIAEKLNQLNNQPVVKVLSGSKNTLAPPLSSNKKAQSSSAFPSPKLQVTVSQGFYNRAMKSPSSDSKSPVTPSTDLDWRSSSHPTLKDLNSPLLHQKPQTAPSSYFNKTSSSLEANKTAMSSRLFLPKPQTISSSLDIPRTSSSLKSNQKVSSSSMSTLQRQETPSLNMFCTSPSLRPNQRALSSTLVQSKSAKPSSLDCLWTSLSEHNQKSLSSPSLKTKSETLNLLQKSPLVQPNPMTLSSSFPASRPQKTPTLKCSPNALSLPLSHLKSRKSHSVHQSQSLPLFQAKSQTAFTFDHKFRTFSSPVCHSAFQIATSQNDKPKATEQASSLKPSVTGLSLSSSKQSNRSSTISAMSSRIQSKHSFSFSAKKPSDKEMPWALEYSLPCIVKGGTVPDKVLNKIVNSISKTKIQKDLSRQILFRRMRGKPNPHPGPRLSTTYTVCLICASCIKSQCKHVTGRKDPRCATLFVIPAPEANFEGKIKVKLVLILSLPENSCLPSSPKDNQPDEAPDDNLEEMRKLSQILPSSESSIIQGLNVKKRWLTSPENKGTRQQPQTIDWLLYVKKSNNLQSLPQMPSPPSSSSSSSSFSLSSASSSPSSSSSSSFALPPPRPSAKVSASSPISSCVVNKVLSHHRLPPGISWLEFICNKDHQPRPRKLNKGQSPLPRTRFVRNRTVMKGTKASSALLKFFQTKFQKEKF